MRLLLEIPIGSFHYPLILEKAGEQRATSVGKLHSMGEEGSLEKVSAVRRVGPTVSSYSNSKTKIGFPVEGLHQKKGKS